MGLIPIQCRTNKLSRVDIYFVVESTAAADSRAREPSSFSFEALEDEVKISTSNYK